MAQQNLFAPIPTTKLQTLTREQLIEFIELQQKVNESIIRDNERLRAWNNELEQKTFLVNEQYIVCLLYTSPSPRDRTRSRMPSSA